MTCHLNVDPTKSSNQKTKWLTNIFSVLSPYFPFLPHILIEQIPKTTLDKLLGIFKSWNMTASIFSWKFSKVKEKYHKSKSSLNISKLLLPPPPCWNSRQGSAEAIPTRSRPKNGPTFKNIKKLLEHNSYFLHIYNKDKCSYKKMESLVQAL